MAHEFRRMMQARRAASVAAVEGTAAHAVARAAVSVLVSNSAAPVPIPEPFAPETITYGTVRAIDPPHYAGGNALRGSDSPFSNTGFISFRHDSPKLAGVVA